MKRATLYARVSSDIQKKEGTVESQVLELKKQITNAGDVLVKEYVDEGYSGARLDRPAMNHLRDDLKNNTFDTIYFLNTDRIAREVTLQTIIIEEIIKNGKQLIINGKDYVKNPENTFSLQVLGAVAQLERAKIAERVGRGKALKLAKGYHPGRGHNIFGYDYIHKKPETESATLKINEREAKIVRLIFETYANSKYGMRMITRMLEEKGHLTKTGKKLWRVGIIKCMLRNHAYIGTMYFNKMETIKEYANPFYGIKASSTKLVARDKSQWVGVKVPPIVSKELFNKVQNKIDYYKKKYRNPRIPQLLSNLIRCGGCGSSHYAYRRYYVDKRSKTPKVYHRASYKCNWRVRILMHSQKSKLKPCDNNEIKTSILEEKVFKLYEDIVSKPELLKQHIEVLKSEGKASQMRLQRQLKKLEDKLKSLSIAKKRVLELYANGNLERAEYAKKGAGYDNEIKQLATEKVELVRQIPLLHKTSVIELSIAQYCDEVRVRVKQCEDFETYRQFFLDFVDHIVYYKNLVELHGYVPIRSLNSDGEQIETQIEYKINTEIEWAERMAQFWKKSGGTRISLMDFNEVAGRSKKMMRDNRVQPNQF
jgi:site-specific DNA recombinase